MKNYNDFQILNDEQYLALQKEYEKQNSTPLSEIGNVLNMLSLCVNSCTLINNNQNLTTSLIFVKDKLKSIKSTLDLLYPNQKSSKKESTSNIFIFLSYLTTAYHLLQKLSLTENRKYYKQTQANVCQSLYEVIQEILNNLSVINVKFYKFM